MKKNLVFLICLILTYFGEIFAQDLNKKAEIKRIIIGVVGKSRSNPVFIASHAGARVAAKEIGAKFNADVIIDWQTPQNENPQEQAEAIERLCRLGTAGIAISCSNAKILTPSINKAVDLGISVVCFDSDAPKSRRLAYYGSDNIDFGRTLLKELAQEMKETGVIAIIGGNKNASNLQVRIQTIIEELKKYPSMKLLPNGIFYHEEIPEKAAEVLNRAQKSNPEIGGWILVGGWPLFIENTIKWEPGQVKVVASDALPAEMEYVKSGHVQVLLAQDCFLWGYKSVELLLNKIFLDQRPINEFISDPPTRVTKENIGEWSLKWNKWMIKDAVYR